MHLDAAMDWQKLTKTASEPGHLRSEINATLRMADEAGKGSDRAEAVRLIEEAYAMSDRLAVMTAGLGSGRLLDSEETPL